jgi:ERCC4-type nuclease
MIILIDTREQKPLFPSSPRATLSVGDYTTKKLKGRFHIERKSLQDLYGTLTKGNGRFKYELFRAAYHHIQLPVYIEGTYDQFINKQFPKGNERKFPKEGLEKLIATFTKRYFIEFVWCGSRQKCIKMAFSRLRMQENNLK